MPLYLVQHGKNLPKEIDPRKVLSPEGVVDVSQIAEVAAGYKVIVSVVEHSGKKRAQQTAEWMAAALTPKLGIREIPGIMPMDNVVEFADTVIPDENRMIVGHLPFMEKLTAFLVSGSEEITVFRFQKGGIVCLDRDTDKSLWYIKWALMPNIS